MARNVSLRRQHHTDLKVLADLGPEEIRRARSALAALHPFPLVYAAFLKSLEAILADHPQAVGPFSRQVLASSRLQQFNGWKASEVVEALSAAIERSKEPLWSSEERKRWKEVEAPFREVLELDGLSDLVKAFDLTYEHAYLLRSSRIITDVRPVFSEDARTVRAAVVIFSLHLDFHGLDGDRTVSVAMDRKDVAELLRKCQRALTKAETAKGLLTDKVGVPVVVSDAAEE